MKGKTTQSILDCVCHFDKHDTNVHFTHIVQYAHLPG